MIVAISYNKVTRAIKRNARGTMELTVTCTSAADGAQMQPVPVPQHLDAMIVTVTHNKVALIIKRDTALTIELPVAAALAADGAHVSPVPVPQY